MLSLKTVANYFADQHEDRWYVFKNFLDEFYYDLRVERIVDEPSIIAGIDYADVYNAYFAATAEYLSRNYVAPEWVFDDRRILRKPWFANDLIKGILIVESPVPFRERNLFVSANALHRV
ncbi:MAG: hypothetical protein SGI71_04540 [Verrucomicrobiota bacterium]|nr:hypothetical protein [Verrucomicrobiota bacterium]